MNMNIDYIDYVYIYIRSLYNLCSYSYRNTYGYVNTRLIIDNWSRDRSEIWLDYILNRYNTVKDSAPKFGALLG